jgi:hypothetical protein
MGKDFSSYATECVGGIDYSIRSPCICIIPPTPVDAVIIPFSDCHFYYLTNSQSHLVDEQNIHGELMGSWSQDEDRYETIAEWAIRSLRKHNTKQVGLEGYAFGASGRLLQIAENTGLLKYHLYKANIHYNIFAPTSIKRMATSNGKSTKDQMYDAWLKDTGVDLQSVFGRLATAKIKSPISDIVDSYYIACSQRIDMIQTNYKYEKEKEDDTRDSQGHSKNKNG